MGGRGARAFGTACCLAAHTEEREYREARGGRSDLARLGKEAGSTERYSSSNISKAIGSTDSSSRTRLP